MLNETLCLEPQGDDLMGIRIRDMTVVGKLKKFDIAPTVVEKRRLDSSNMH